MASFYKRYLAGEREAVWAELSQFGLDVRSKQLHADVRDVAKVIVDRAFHNLSLLHHRLVELGYQFDDPEAALVESTEEATRLLDDAEQSLGAFPVILRAWYERVASVNFSQARRQLYGELGEEPAEPASVTGLGLNVVLDYLSIPKCMELRRSLLEEEQDDPEQEGASWLSDLFPTGGWASNCNPKGIHLPNQGFDGVLFNEGLGDVYFVQELRTAFSWGGFPFWKISLSRKRFVSPLRKSPDFARLFPILADGLLPL